MTRAAVLLGLVLAQSPLYLRDEGTYKGRALDGLDCQGSGLECAMSGSRARITVGPQDGGAFVIPSLPRASFPSAASSIGGIIFDLTAGVLRYSDGTLWLHSVPGSPDGGPLTVAQGSTWVVNIDGGVAINNWPASYPVTGTFWQATQPVSGTVSLGGGSTAINNFPAYQSVRQSTSMDGGSWAWTVQVLNPPSSIVWVDGGTVAINNFPTTYATIPPELSASQTGYIGTKRAMNINVMGRRQNGWTSTSAFNDCTQYLDGIAMNTVVDAGTPWCVLSSSNHDVNDAGATGARSVRIVSLNTAGNWQTSTVNLNGIVPVLLGGSHSYFEWMEVASVGSQAEALTGNTGTAFGNLSITSVCDGGTPNGGNGTIVEYIASGGNRSLSGRFKVPTGWSAYLRGASATNIGTTTMDVRLRARAFADDRSGGETTPFHFNESMYLSAAGEVDRTIDYLKVPAGAEIKMSAISGNVSADNKLDCDFHFLMVED